MSRAALRQIGDGTAAEGDALKISVIIPTHNRKEMLREHLLTLARQACPPARFEVVVVDGGSGDGTAEMMASLEGAMPYPLKSLRQGNLGPGSNRNLGIRNSDGDVLLFINDDVIPDDRLLLEHLEFHERNREGNIAMLGRVVQAADARTTPFMEFFEPFAYWSIEGETEVDYRYFWTCNISVKRSFLLEKGLFDDSVAYPAHEDVELGYRLCRQGLRIVYNDRALGHHHHFQTFDGECRHQYLMGYYLYFLWDKVPDWRVYERLPVICWRMPRLLLARRIARHLGRLVSFNRLTVPWVFAPLVRRLERSPRGAAWARPLYWKIFTYHYRTGVADGFRDRSAVSIFNLVILKPGSIARRLLSWRDRRDASRGRRPERREGGQ